MEERTITVVNPFTNEEKTETFYFQLRRSDALDMELLDRPDVEEYLQSIMRDKNAVRTLRVVKAMTLAAVGIKIDNQFVKRGIAQKFEDEGYWSVFFEQLFQQDNPMEFILAILPKDVREDLVTQHEKQYTNEELMAMTDEAFYKVAGTTNVADMDKRYLTIAFARKSNKSSDAA